MDESREAELLQEIERLSRALEVAEGVADHFADQQGEAEAELLRLEQQCAKDGRLIEEIITERDAAKAQALLEAAVELQALATGYIGGIHDDWEVPTRHAAAWLVDCADAMTATEPTDA